MPSFLTPELLAWGLPLAAAPILIHLINLARRKRVAWAAMEFLLASQKKNNTWIRIRELLLLLMRIAAIVTVTLMLAQPLLRDDLGRLLGGRRTHAIILLDDSYSMSARAGDASAFDRAKQAVARLTDLAAAETTPQDFTLIPFSLAETIDAPDDSDATASARRPEVILQTRVDSAFADRLKELLVAMTPSALASDVRPALARVIALNEQQSSDDERVVYILSDFRKKDWTQAAETEELLKKLDAAGVKIHFVRCTERALANLALVDLQPAAGARAAKTPMDMEATVVNYSTETVHDVNLSIQEDAGTRNILFDELKPGETATRRFPVIFAAAGQRAVTAALPLDSVAADNTRFSIVDVPVSTPVLLVQDAARGADADVLATVFAPGGAARTGLSPEIETPSYLTAAPLSKFRSVFMLDVERLDEAAVTEIEAYVQHGGGVAFFLGPRTQASFVNESLYRDGKGLFPLPLQAHTPLIVDRREPAPDIEISDHPIFKVFAGERNPFLSAVRIDRFWMAPKGWTPPPGVRVLATLRNGAPLVVEQKFGEGRVLVVLTTCAPLWNNWAQNPSFVVAALEMQGYLATRAAENEPRIVGSKLPVELDAAKYQPTVRLDPPVSSGSTAASVARQAKQSGISLHSAFDETRLPGVYYLRLMPFEGGEESRAFAFNVDSREGDLDLVSPEDLATRFRDLSVEIHRADDYQGTARQLAGASLTDWLLYFLMALLIGEQCLAYFASYHRSPAEAIR